jgi:hypothetical protein
MGVKGWLLAGIAAVMIAVGAQAQTSGSETARQAVLDATDEFARAYGAGAAPRAALRGAAADPTALATNNLAAVVDQFDENATYAGTLQPFWLRGKAQIQDLWSRYFARYPDRRLILRDRDAQVFGNAAVETGYAEMYMGSSPLTSVPTFMRYSIARTLRDGRWVIVSMIVDRLPSEQPPAGTMPPWANTPPPAP